MTDTVLNTEFKDTLIEYIVEYIFENNLQRHNVNSKEQAKKYLNTKGVVGGHISQALKIPIEFTEISFPEIHQSEEDDYQYILTKLKSIEFSKCKFGCNSLDKVKIPCSFRNCTFTNKYQLYNHECIEKDSSLYDGCIFKKQIIVPSYNSENCKSVLFKDCKFKTKLTLTNLVSDIPIFDLSSSDIQLRSLTINCCEFSNKFILNKIKNISIDKIKISNSIFNSKFELKNNKVGILKIEDTNFKNIVDFFDTNFNEVHFEKCIIEDFIGFEKCEFGSNESSAEEEKSQFVYTTFKNIPNFRSTKFKSGLDIETANFMGTPNFLNSEVSQKNTNRETFRIIKNSFDKVGNHIEANKFFVLEMKKRRAELEKTNDRQEMFIFKWNDRLSGFGQSYLKPLVWLILAIVILWVLDVGKNQKWLYVFDEKNNTYISAIVGQINNIAGYFLPFKKFLIPRMEIISLIFYIIFLILIWQIIVAVKRHTKR